MRSRAPVPNLTAVLIVAIPLTLLEAGSRPSPAAADNPLFGAGIPYEVAPYPLGGPEPPRSIAVGDLNGDGNPDLVLANYNGTSSFSVLPGNGDGTFGTRADYSEAGIVEWGTTSVALADLNADGRLDVVVGGGEGSIRVLLGHGDGTFDPGIGVLLGTSYFDNNRYVAIGDLNADGRLDLVAVAAGGPLSVLLGKGDGTFQPQTDYPLPELATCAAIGDLNRDGAPDVATANLIYSSNVSIFLGNGDGTLKEPRGSPPLDYPASVSIADLNRDGNPDLVTGNWGSSVSVLAGDGSGDFSTVTGYQAHHRSEGFLWPNQLAAVGDLNGDGRPDIVTADNFAATGAPGLLVLLGKGDGTFTVDRIYGSKSSSAVAIADLNRDGKPDLVSLGEVLLNVSISLEFDPETLNLRAPRQWVMATLGLPAPFTASDVDLSSIRLDGAVAPSSGKSVEDGSNSLELKFAWESAKGLFEPGDHVVVTVTGTMVGQPFEASDEIRIVDKGRQGGASGQGAGLALHPLGLAEGASKVRFRLADEEAATLETYDVRGRLVGRRSVTSSAGWHTVTLGDLPSGVYWLRLKQAGRSETSKVVVIR